MKKEIVYSALQPSGSITIGNYLGAIKNMIRLQDEGFDCFYSIADMHALTVEIAPSELRQNTLQLAAILLASGLDPEKCTLSVQSHVHQHAELAWVLNCYTYIGEASRMIQFKEKSKKHSENINVGLFAYPVLMASDILIYCANYVPVGKDQKQHIELARNLAMRFNNKFSDTFPIPEPLVPKNAAKIMSLTVPTAKMSKSDADENSSILLTDSPDVIMKKMKRAVTDSDNSIKFGQGKSGIANLLNIYSIFTEKTIKQAEAEFEGVGYGVFKPRVAEAIIEGLKGLQTEYARLMSDKPYLLSVLKRGEESAKFAARRTLSKVHRKVGFLTPSEEKS